MGKGPDEVSANFAKTVKEATVTLMANYINDDRNYAVDGAIISCDQMCEAPVTIKYEHGMIYLVTEGSEVEIPDESGKYKEGHIVSYQPQLQRKIGILSAVHTDTQTDNSRCFATVTDRLCLRDKIEQGLEEEESIISIGNCNIARQSDIIDIEEREDKASAYGTCYCLIKPVLEWTNPICIESLVGDHNDEAAGAGRVLEMAVCNRQDHHTTMEWDTKDGKKEGLTKFSKLLCTRGGVITIKFSGQSVDSGELYEYKIYEKILLISDHTIGRENWKKEMENLSAIEILARMIYQESHTYQAGEQNAVLYSFINRCFSTENFGATGDKKTIKNLLLADSQYQSLAVYSAAYYPPQGGDDDEYWGWENAKQLAAIMMIAMEDNMPANGVDDIGMAIIVEDEYIKEGVCEEIENLRDIDGKKIENPIGDFPSFRGKDGSYIPKEGEIFIHSRGDERAGGNVFRAK